MERAGESLDRFCCSKIDCVKTRFGKGAALGGTEVVGAGLSPIFADRIAQDLRLDQSRRCLDQAHEQMGFTQIVAEEYVVGDGGGFSIQA